MITAAALAAQIEALALLTEIETELTRYVRTPEGARRYGLPIGSPIVTTPTKTPTAEVPAARPATVDELLADKTDEELALALVALVSTPDRPGKAAAVAELDAELARREGVASLTVNDDQRSRQVDDLIRRGWSYADAYADTYGQDADRIVREERDALIGRHKGERTEARSTSAVHRVCAHTVA